MFHFRLNFNSSWQTVGDSGFPNVCDMRSVFIAKNFVQAGGYHTDDGYHSFGESARFT